MRFRMLVGIAFVLNLVLSNVCLVGSAYAATPGSGGARELLSREIPMSFNVVTCAWVKTDEGWQPAEGSPCASGKCIKKAPSDTPCLFPGVATRVPAHFPAPLPADATLAIERSLPLPAPDERPPPYPGFASTVLRM
jgi:hypothetical protein